MGAGHTHAPATATGRHRGRLLVVLCLTLTVLVVEVVGALLSGSLALLADAGHMATDAAGLAIALIASVLAARPVSERRTFGWQRLEILAAALNAVLLLGVAGFVLVEGARRLTNPPQIDSGLMLIVAVIGLLANAVGLRLLFRAQAESLNVRGAYLEVLGDLLGSVAVVVAALVVALAGFTPADALASLVVGLLVLPRAWSLLREVTDVLLEGTPKGVDLDEVRAHIRGIEGVLDVHDLHAWTITSGMPVLSAHVVVEDAALARGHGARVLDALGDCLVHDFDVPHCTFQLEPMTHREHEHAPHPCQRDQRADVGEPPAGWQTARTRT